MTSNKIKVYIDFETYSELDLKKTDVRRYAAHPSTEILCMAIAVNDDEPIVIARPDSIVEGLKEESTYGARPEESTYPEYFRICDLIASGAIFTAHNAAFERALWKEKMVPAGYPDIPLEQWRCTQAKAAVCCLPRSLDGCAKALNLSEKDTVGARVMGQLSRPRKPTKDDPSTRYSIGGHLEKYEALYEYCKQDVIVEREIDKALPDLSPTELEIWFLDQRANDYGVKFDMESVNNACILLGEHQKRLAPELESLTGGLINSAGQTKRLKEFLGSEDTQAPTLQRYVDSKEGTEAQVRVAEIRLDLASASVKKYLYVKQNANSEGVLKSVLNYHGASTGRWSGRGVQLQNFPRKGFSDPELALDYLNTGDYDIFKLGYGDLTAALKKLLKPMIIPRYGKALFVADFASIEARVLSWLAGEESLLSAFQNNIDAYKQMASLIYGKEIDAITPDERQLGKVAVLGCGYQMWVDRFYEQCIDFKVPGITKPLAKMAVTTYRDRYTKIVDYWESIEEAVKYSIRNPGKVLKFGKLKIKTDSTFLVIKLPSGRNLFYFKPQVRVTTKMMRGGYEKTKETIGYMGTDSQRGNRWCLVDTYGGKLTENIVQAIARDFMAEAMIRCDRADYILLFTVHDEVVCEKDKRIGTVEEFRDLMLVIPDWGEGCPIWVEEENVYKASRYRK